MAPDHSNDVARILADLDSADDDRELIDRFDATLLSPDLNDETHRVFALEVHSTGWLERVNAARDRDMTRRLVFFGEVGVGSPFWCPGLKSC